MNSIFLADFDEIKTENIYSNLTYMFLCLYAIDRFPNLNSRSTINISVYEIQNVTFFLPDLFISSKNA